jgi:hypothetical protein
MLQAANNACWLVVQSGRLYVSPKSKVSIDSIPLTVLSVAQGWQYKACPVPEHNAGPRTVGLAIFFVIFTAFCVGGRFIARWRIQNATIGIDDWTILASYILMIPATVLIILSKLPKLSSSSWLY